MQFPEVWSNGIWCFFLWFSWQFYSPSFGCNFVCIVFYVL